VENAVRKVNGDNRSRIESPYTWIPVSE